LQQVVWNLLSNAVKFTPNWGHVHAQLRQSEGYVELVVSDTGQGIDKEFLPYVFERFRQADSSTTRQHGGLGLGLAIVRHLVELHGGTVAAESAGEGEGTKFTVRLPFAGGRAKAVGEADASSARLAASAAVFDCQPELAGLRVLVVDDEEDTLELLRMVLERCDIEVTTASSVADAIRAFESAPPDILISDIGMPVEDGYQLIGRVRRLASDRGGGTPAIALTAYAGEADRRRALSSGYQMHMAKPIEPNSLIRAIAGLIRSEEKVGG
jgi:CheY-like chemotaxis protein